MRINHNIASLNSYRQLSTNNTLQTKSLEKLSSGLRINRAGDDAAGLAISEKMRGQIRGLEQATRNSQDGISLIQTAEGGLTETHSILQRMRELAVQAANDTLTPDDRTSITTEISQLTTEIGRIGTSTKFNTKNLLDGTLGIKHSGGTLDSTYDGFSATGTIDVTGAKAGTYTIANSTAGQMTLTDASGNSQTIVGLSSGVQTINFDALGVSITVSSSFSAGIAFDNATIIASGTAATFQIGADQGQTMAISIGDMQASALGVNNLDLSSNANAGSAVTTIDAAITLVSEQRAELGAYQNRLEHSINNLQAASENLTASESRIRDVDMAKEMMEFTKNNILQQAATAMLAQANQQPQGVLQLLK